MKIAVLGTGSVGRTLAGGLAGVGHRITLGTRDPEQTRARGEGTEAFGAWAAENPDIPLATFAEAAKASELIVHAGHGAAALEILAAAGEDNLAGKVLIDVSNPLDLSQGFPPTLFVKDSDSLAEMIQRTFPGARVVKTLNTLTAALMVQPGLLPSETTVFVSGNDAEAKATVTALLESLGHTDVLDLGDITTARGQEMALQLWLRILMSQGTAMFNYKIVR